MNFDWADMMYGFQGYLSVHKEFAALLAVVLGCVLAQLFKILCRHNSGKTVVGILVIIVVSGHLIFGGWREATLGAVITMLGWLP